MYLIKCYYWDILSIVINIWIWFPIKLLGRNQIGFPIKIHRAADWVNRASGDFVTVIKTDSTAVSLLLYRFLLSKVAKGRNAVYSLHFYSYSLCDLPSASSFLFCAISSFFKNDHEVRKIEVGYFSSDFFLTLFTYRYLTLASEFRLLIWFIGKFKNFYLKNCVKQRINLWSDFYEIK